MPERIHAESGGNSVTVDLPTPEVRRAVQTFRREGLRIGDEVLGLASEQTVSDAQVESPVLTGAMRESHFVRQERPFKRTLGASIQYSAAVHKLHPSKAGWFRQTVLAKAAGYFFRLVKSKSDELAARTRSRSRGES